MTAPDNLEMSSEEFELTVRSYLEEMGHDLGNFQIEHNVKKTSPDGTYQIDILVNFEALGASIKVLVECKHHRSAIKREVVQVLKDRLHSLGAQKGMLFSTSSFQSGCIEYAEQHGIALVRMIEGKYTYETKAYGGIVTHYPPGLPKYVGQYIYNKIGDSYTSYNIQKGWIDGLKELILK